MTTWTPDQLEILQNAPDTAPAGAAYVLVNAEGRKAIGFRSKLKAITHARKLEKPHRIDLARVPAGVVVLDAQPVRPLARRGARRVASVCTATLSGHPFTGTRNPIH